MNDFKSKLPDMQELGAMTSKLFHGIKQTVTEIVHDYKTKRAQEAAEQTTHTTVTQTPVVSEPEQEKTNATPAPDAEKEESLHDKTVEDKK